MSESSTGRSFLEGAVGEIVLFVPMEVPFCSLKQVLSMSRRIGLRSMYDLNSNC